MSGARWISGGLGALAVAAGAAWWLQRQETDALRTEIALLREERGEWEKLQAENRRLAAQGASAEEVARLHADHAAIGRLRAEIEALKAKTEVAAQQVAAEKRGP
jgi:hypothetical protein